MTWLQRHWQILTVIVFGAALRFYGYADWSLSNDELSYLTRFHLSNAWEVFLYGMSIDVHPPAVQTLLYYWTSLFGDSPASIRLPFVLLGTGSIYLIYQIGKNWFNESTGLLSAVFLSGLAYPLLFSRVARPYGFGVFAILLTALFIGRILQTDKPKVMDMIGMAVGLALCAYTHYFCALSASIMAGVGLIYCDRSNRKQYIIAGVGALILFSPYLAFIEEHLSQGGLDDWLATPDRTWILDYLFQAANNSWLVCLTIPCIILIGMFFRSKSNFKTSLAWMCFAIFFGSFLVGYIYSVQVEPVMQYSGLMFAFPFLLLGIFGMISMNKKALNYVIPVAILFLGFDTVANQNFYTTEHYGVFEELAEKAIETKQNDPNALLIADVNHELYLDYYSKRLGQKDQRFDNYSLTQGDDLKRLHWLCKESKAKTCLLVWSTKGQLAEHAAIVEHYFPTIMEVGDHFNSGYVLFSSEPSADHKMEFRFQGSGQNSWGVNPKGLKADSAGFTFNMTDSTEYGPTWEVELTDDLTEFNSITVTVEANCESTESQFQLVCAQQLMDGSDHWESRPFSLQVQPGKKSVAVFRFKLLDEAKIGGKLKVYPWLPPSGQTASISELKIDLAVRASFQ